MLHFIFISMLGGVRPDVSRDLSPQQIRAAVRSDGAKAVVKRLDASGQWWKLTKHIAEGKRDWIALAPSLSEGTDAGTSESLKLSLAYALPKNPLDVLKVIDPSGRSATRAASEVCSSPFVEDDPEHRRSYKAATLKALADLTASRLRDVAVACADELRKVG